MVQPLSRVSIPGCEVLSDPSGSNVYHVTTPHALTQAAGYLKFVRGPSKQAVFFRGQRKLYGRLSPSLYRGLSTQKGQGTRSKAIRAACLDIASKNSIFDQIPPEAHEPLLQHYGLNTSWIDLVDNVWVALWFACHRALTTGAAGQFLHFERRNPADETEAPWAYILLIAGDAVVSEPYVPGLWRGSWTEVVDLRIAAPSLFLRPHAQHGVLFRMRANSIMRPLDYSQQVVDIIRIDLRHALAWLGEGAMLSTHALFPPPYYDRGYSFLLDTTEVYPEVGTVHHVGT